MASIVDTNTLSLEVAMQLSSLNNLDPSIQDAIEMNEVNIRTLIEEKNALLEEIKTLKKEYRKMERDYDVLFFDYQMARTDETPNERKGKCMAIE
jgi:hypothetical protein